MSESLKINSEIHKPSRLFRNFNENGHQIFVYMAGNSSELRQWLIRAYAQKDREPVLETTLPMQHDYKFHVSSEDLETLEDGLLQISNELTSIVDNTFKAHEIGEVAIKLSIDIADCPVAEEYSSEKELLVA